MILMMMMMMMLMLMLIMMMMHCIVWVGNIMTFENLFSLKLAHVFFGGLQGSCPLCGG